MLWAISFVGAFIGLYRCAAATSVGLLLSTWFTYLAGLACYRTAEPLLWSDILFFVTAAAAVFWLSRKSPKLEMIEPGAPGRAVWDWITLGALFVAVCILLIGTLYVNKQGRIRLLGIEVSDFGPQLAIAQGVALGDNFPSQSPYYAGQAIHSDFRFYFQAGNLEFLGLNLAWSVDVLSVLVLASTLALVMALGELLFSSRVVGRLGAALFFFHGSLQRLTNFLATGHAHRDQTWGFWKQLAFVDQFYHRQQYLRGARRWQRAGRVGPDRIDAWGRLDHQRDQRRRGQSDRLTV